MRSLFMAIVFSAASVSCVENQFAPLSHLESPQVTTSDKDGNSQTTTFAEDGEYVIITPESLSSGGKRSSSESEDVNGTPAADKDIPPEVFNDPDFGGSHPGADKPDEDSELPTEEVLNDVDVSLKGNLRPTVYYYPVINEDKRKCERTHILRDDDGEKMISLCEATRASCRLQGSCAVIQNGKKRTFNIIGQFDGKDHFFETSKDVCRFGFGVKSSCLDPFYTVAADLNIYSPGDVIYVPVVRGVELPDGSKHSGYFIVRDTGRNIIGKTRFDFFTGHISWRDEKNPFRKIGLAYKANKFAFMKMKGEKAQAFSISRGYPKLPVKTVKH